MARATYKVFPGIYEPGKMALSDGALTSGTSGKAVFTDFDSGDKIIIEGKGLKYDDGLLQDGTVSKISVVDANGEKYQIFEDFKFNVQLLSGDNLIDQLNDLSGSIVSGNIKVIGGNGADRLVSRMGNDIVFGRGGDDVLSGEGGRDILIGGSGNDEFVFDDNFGKDTIRDFDANGGDGFQDHIYAEFDAVEAITRFGRNTVIDFGDGDTLTLLNIRPSEIDQSDFI